MFYKLSRNYLNIFLHIYQTYLKLIYSLVLLNLLFIDLKLKIKKRNDYLII
jgi:hypothetical protein